MSDDYYVEDAEVRSKDDFMLVDDASEEYLEVNGENDFIEELPAYAAKQEDYMDGHLVMQRLDENGSDYYHCLQCAEDYATLEDYAEAHTPDDVTSDGIIDTDKHWDVLEDTNDDDDRSLVTNETDLIVEDGIGGDINLEDVSTTCPEEKPIKQESDDKTFFCCECHDVFGSMEHAEEHDCPAIRGEQLLVAEQQPETKSLTCELCQKQFKSMKAMVAHKRFHKSKRPIPEKPTEMKTITTTTTETTVCDVCNTVFTSQKNLNSHMRIHMQNRMKSIQEVLPDFAKSQYNELNQFHCEICNKSFEQNLLEVHRNMHQNLEEYTCQVCNKQFENLPSYEVHMQMHKDVNRRAPRKRPDTQERLANVKTVYPCQYCGHVFARPFEKVKHERVHTGEKPYACEVCGKTFRVSYSLTLHLRTHTDIRPYVCPTCNKRFKAHSVYAHHLKTHQNERAYKCDLCSKAYRTSVQLNSHKKSHLKPYSCPDCNRPFSSMYSVKVHMKTHNKANKSNEQLKHRCQFCGAVYARIFALRYHLRDQHSVEMGSTNTMPNDMYLPSELTETTANDADDGSQATNVELMLDSNEAVLIAAAAEADSIQYSVVEQDNIADAVGDDGLVNSGVGQKIEVFDWQ